jgi:hypothetical protein
MKRLLIAGLMLVMISGCLQGTAWSPVREVVFDLPPSRMATDSDAIWIQQLDYKLMGTQRTTMAKHDASFESRRKLWKSLECVRGVYIGKARATELITVRKGILRKDAMREVDADPRWVIADQGCDRE